MFRLTTAESIGKAWEVDLTSLGLLRHSSIPCTTLNVVRYGAAPEKETIEWMIQKWRIMLDSLDDEANPMLGSFQKRTFVIRDLDLQIPRSLSFEPGTGTLTGIDSFDLSTKRRIVCVACWKYAPEDWLERENEVKPRKEIDAAEASHNAKEPDTFNIEVIGMRAKALKKSKEKWMGGKPHFFLDYIATLLPSHGRQGLASTLVRYLFPRADRDNLPIYLEASEVGIPLYEHLGFVTLERTIFDLRPHGADASYEGRSMVRYPENPK